VDPTSNTIVSSPIKSSTCGKTTRAPSTGTDTITKSACANQSYFPLHQ
jgi:hypothetical protein